MFCSYLVAKIMRASSALFLKATIVFFDGLIHHCYSVEFNAEIVFRLSDFVESQDVWLFAGDYDLEQ